MRVLAAILSAPTDDPTARANDLKGLEKANSKLESLSKAVILLCHKLSFCALDGTALACTCWQHGQRGRRRAKATVRRRRIEMIDNGLWRSGRIGMPSRPLVRG